MPHFGVCKKPQKRRGAPAAAGRRVTRPRGRKLSPGLALPHAMPVAATGGQHRPPMKPCARGRPSLPRATRTGRGSRGVSGAAPGGLLGSLACPGRRGGGVACSVLSPPFCKSGGDGIPGAVLPRISLKRFYARVWLPGRPPQPRPRLSPRLPGELQTFKAPECLCEAAAPHSVGRARGSPGRERLPVASPELELRSLERRLPEG